MTVAALTVSTLAGIGCLIALFKAISDEDSSVGIAIPAIGLFFAVLAPFVWLTPQNGDGQGPSMSSMPEPIPTAWNWYQSHTSIAAWVLVGVCALITVAIARLGVNRFRRDS